MTPRDLEALPSPCPLCGEAESFEGNSWKFSVCCACDTVLIDSVDGMARVSVEDWAAYAVGKGVSYGGVA